MGKEHTKRLFIAINFNNVTRSKLITLRDELQSCSECGRFSLPENLHLTLVFLGECNAKQTAAAKAAMDAVDFNSFSISIDNMGRFRRRGGDIWWAGVNECKPLLELQWDLNNKLIAAGFDLETRKYSPHITLGRDIKTKAEARMIEPFGEDISKVDLMKSEHIGGKLIYTPIYSTLMNYER